MLLLTCLDCGEELLSFALSTQAICPVCKGQKFVLTVYQQNQYFQYAIDLDLVNEYDKENFEGVLL